MSEQKVKSNAPWILGLVGFGVSLPQVICSILCAAAAADVAAEAAMTGAGSEAVTTAAAFGTVAVLNLVCTFACFILSFLGKSKFSKITGILLILLGLANIYMCVANFSALGIVGSILFACAGISSCCNAGKIKG